AGTLPACRRWKILVAFRAVRSGFTRSGTDPATATSSTPVMAYLTPSRLAVAFVCALFLLTGANGCASDPDVEGAKLYIRNEEYDQALENLNRALAGNPDNVEAHALKAEVLRLQ